MAASSTSDAPAASTEGPVLSLINKRIRALRKKQNRIIQMEDSLSQGKALNKEQQETLRSKSGVIALIDELEKLRSPLSAAVAEEISLAVQGHQEQHSSAPQSVDGSGSASAADAAAEEMEAAAPTVSGGDREGDVVEDLLNLIYFGSLFDVMPQSDFTSTMLTRTHERGCCLTYDYVTDDANDLLEERDLDLIATLKGLIISRPLSSILSHKNALQRCIEHVKLWLAKSDQAVDPEANVTYVGLREKLSKIISSDYYTTTPEMRGSVEMAAAAGVASFGSFQVPLHGVVMPVSIPVQAEESIGQYQEEEENVNHEEYHQTVGEHQSVPAEELQKNSDQEIAQEEFEEQQHEDIDSKEQQQYAPRRPYQNHRGGGGRGGRRGYPNGRGGRGSGRGGVYQSGRGQYYDEGSNYYPRNTYRGRGGSGGGGGGGNTYYNYNNSSGMQGAHAQSNAASVS